MTNWDFYYAIVTKLDKNAAWDFLSDMSNQVRMEPGIENIELDGPFATGTKGRTISKYHTQEWELDDVVEGSQFTIVGYTQNQDMKLSFTWQFEDEGTGARLRQRISASGTQIEKYAETFRGMEIDVPKRLKQLAEELDGIASKR